MKRSSLVILTLLFGLSVQGSAEVVDEWRELTSDWTLVVGQHLDPAIESIPVDAHLVDTHPGERFGVSPEQKRAGYGTYLLHLQLPDTTTPYGLTFPKFYGACAVYANGRLLGQRGTIATTKEDYEPWTSSMLLELPRSEEISLVVHVTNFDFAYGGAHSPVRFGKYSTLLKQMLDDAAVAVFIIGLLFAVGIGVFVAWLLSKRWKSSAQPAFSTLCFCLAAYICTSSSDIATTLFNSQSFDLLYRIQDLSLLTGTLALWRFASVTAFKAEADLTRFVNEMSVCVALMSLSYAVFPLAWISGAYVLMVIPVMAATLRIYYLSIVAAGWDRRDIALSRLSIYALGAAFLLSALNEASVLSAPLYVSLFLYVTFAIIGAFAFLVQNNWHEQKLRRKTLAASEAKSQFLARLSHELRTPLHGVQGALKLASQSEDPAELTEFLGIAQRSNGEMQRLINSLLDFNDLSANSLELNWQATDLHSAVVASVELGRVADRDVEVILELRTERKTVRIDRQRVQEMLANLLSNAAKFGDGSRIKLSAIDVREGLRLSVTNWGTPLDDAVAQRLGTPFRQEESYLQRSQGGLGLGLALTKSLAKLMGSELHYRQLVTAQGCEFWFVLPADSIAVDTEVTSHQFEVPREQVATTEALHTPLVVSQDDAAPQPHTAKSLSAKPRVLIAEDHPINQKIAARMVERWGLEPVVCTNGRIAVETLSRDENFDVVLMDLQMPEMDGLEATRLIRARFGESLPIIALTANVSAEDKAACRAVGMQDFIGKPFKPDELKAAITRFIPGHFPTEPAAIERQARG